MFAWVIAEMIMTVTVLQDNIGRGDLKGEWGLSLLIEYGGNSFLLDTGASDTFLSNAEYLGIDISSVDFAILSHAHYDHAGGLEAFLKTNGKAPVYLSSNAQENCYAGLMFLSKYIGMPQGVVRRYPKRIVRVGGIVEITEGVFLIPHSSDGLSKIGRRNHLYVRKGLRYFPDDFSHELTLAFRTPDGLVLMNSCSHSGPEVIVEEALKLFPGEKVKAYVGGLHLFRLNEKEVRDVSEHLANCDIDRIYTGHCTGQKAYDILRERFIDKVEQFCCGKQFEIC